MVPPFLSAWFASKCAHTWSVFSFLYSAELQICLGVAWSRGAVRADMLHFSWNHVQYDRGNGCTHMEAPANKGTANLPWKYAPNSWSALASSSKQKAAACPCFVCLCVYPQLVELLNYMCLRIDNIINDYTEYVYKVPIAPIMTASEWHIWTKYWWSHSCCRNGMRWAFNSIN